eukprot:366075-Chlamydomonas_euryale.AAC.3
MLMCFGICKHDQHDPCMHTPARTHTQACRYTWGAWACRYTWGAWACRYTWGAWACRYTWGAWACRYTWVHGHADTHGVHGHADTHGVHGHADDSSSLHLATLSRSRLHECTRKHMHTANASRPGMHAGVDTLA